MTDAAMPGPDEPISQLVDALHHTYGENDLIVARRQLRGATGEQHERWMDIINLIKTRRNRD